MLKKKQEGGHKLIDTLPAISIQGSEQYYFRILMLHRSCATKFSVLEIFNGI